MDSLKSRQQKRYNIWFTQNFVSANEKVGYVLSKFDNIKSNLSEEEGIGRITPSLCRFLLS